MRSDVMMLLTRQAENVHPWASIRAVATMAVDKPDVYASFGMSDLLRL